MSIPRLITALLCVASASAARLDLTVDPSTGEPGRFAAAEIRREAAAKGIDSGGDAHASRVVLTIGKAAEAIPQSYAIRVGNDQGRRIVTVTGGDAAGAMYGGLDVAEAITTPPSVTHIISRRSTIASGRST